MQNTIACLDATRDTRELSPSALRRYASTYGRGPAYRLVRVYAAIHGARAARILWEGSGLGRADFSDLGG